MASAHADAGAERDEAAARGEQMNGSAPLLDAMTQQRQHPVIEVVDALAELIVTGDHQLRRVRRRRGAHVRHEVGDCEVDLMTDRQLRDVQTIVLFLAVLGLLAFSFLG